MGNGEVQILIQKAWNIELLTYSIGYNYKANVEISVHIDMSLTSECKQSEHSLRSLMKLLVDTGKTWYSIFWTVSCCINKLVTL